MRLVCKAHRLLYHSTLGLRVTKKNNKHEVTRHLRDTRNPESLPQVARGSCLTPSRS